MKFTEEEGHRLKVFENKVLKYLDLRGRKVKGSYTLRSFIICRPTDSSNIVTVSKSRRLICEEYVARMGKMRNACTILVGNWALPKGPPYSITCVQ